MQSFLNVFYTKTRSSHGLLPYMELLREMFSTISDMKNANSAKRLVSKVVRKIVSNFNVSVAVKWCRYNNRKLED